MELVKKYNGNINVDICDYWTFRYDLNMKNKYTE